MTPAGPSTETIQQIGAYGFTSSLTVTGADESRRSFRSVESTTYHGDRPEAG